MVRGKRGDRGITSWNSALGAAKEAQSASGVRGTDAILIMSTLTASIGCRLEKKVWQSCEM
jgi:hypothetical protein